VNADTYKEEDTAGLASPSEAFFNLRCLTFNVLHDPAPYRAASSSSKDASPSSSAASSPEPPKESSTATTIQDETYPELRRAHTFEFLRSRNAHIITLNEVSKEFYANLLQEPWAQAYWIASLGDESLTPGNLILSQFPIKSSFAHQLKFSHKIINIVELVVPSKSGKTIWLATGHLKAGPLAAYGRFRRSQVNEIVQQLHYQTSNSNYIIMGDLNIRTSEKEHIPQLDSWTDVWPTLHPNDEGLTYDPWSNSLAEFASNRICTIDSTRTKVSNRYDRIYIKCPRLQPISAEILGNTPLGTFPSGRVMYMSDHWALEAILKLETA
jgi:endonuclease/exonuclease/phosphatase family metal-dependent hydrolase